MFWARGLAKILSPDDAGGFAGAALGAAAGVGAAAAGAWRAHPAGLEAG